MKHPRLVVPGLVLAAILAGEASLELLGLGHPALVTTHSPANYELLPNQHIRRLWPLSASLVAHLRTNAYGLRSDPISPIKPAGALRLYFLGDSITYGTTQVDQRQIFTELVHSELPSLLHQPVEVLNGAISGWAISNELAYLREHGLYQSDRLILVLNDGDPRQPMSPTPLDYGIPSVALHPRFGYQELWTRGLQPSLSHSLVRMGLHLAPQATLDPGIASGSSEATLRHNLGLLTAMDAYVRAAGSQLSILYFPWIEPSTSPRERADIQSGHDAIRGWAAAAHVPFIDLAPDLEHAFAHQPRESFVLRDRTHLNPAGHRLVATAIEAHWRELTSPTPAPPPQ